MARPPGFDRQQVLTAVERQFRKTGYAGTSLDDLCAATGLGRGSLYAAFGDKHSLFLAAFGSYCDRNESFATAALGGPDDHALERLRCFLVSSVSTVFDDSDRLGCMALKFAVELAGEDEAVATRIKQDLGLLQGMVRECVEAAQRAGHLDPEIPAGELASLVVTMSRGLDVVSQASGAETAMQAVAERAFASLPLTAAGRRAIAVAVAV
ncbi:TetR/AcrR family transcriptional regulator [Acidothermaceae bacterium B102]|nr:TetR/AcrR family transcriptional regulator [Acidothermaceae bacterium B102]